MYVSEFEMIKDILRKRGLEHLICEYLSYRRFSCVVDILDMKEWKNESFRPLLTSNIWNANLKMVEKVLKMEEWKDEKFRPLLTSNIWQANLEIVEKVLKMEEWEDEKFRPLLTSNIWKANPEMVEKVLKMEEWKDEKFEHLLTATIWHSSIEDIKKRLDLPYWSNPVYKNLLSSTIWAISIKRIEDIIQLFENLGLEKYIKISHLRKSSIQIKALYHYLIDHNIDIIIDNKLHPVFCFPPIVLKQKYGIELSKLVKLEKEREDNELPKKYIKRIAIG